MSVASVAQRQQLLSQWVPMPRYLLRCWVVKRIVRSLAPRDFIEIGAASGDMAQWLAHRGLSGVAVEISPQALSMMRARLQDESRVQIFDRDSRHLQREADLVLSMEVLEHLADDHAALSDWYRLVRPGGHLLLSVPAGQRLFSIEDEMVGHYRRYERDELAGKIRAAGFRNPRILSYGFPLGLLLKYLRNVNARRKSRRDSRTRQERTESSGVERDFTFLRWILNDACFLPFHLLQMPFLHCDLTDGYIAIAEKPAGAS